MSLVTYLNQLRYNVEQTAWLSSCVTTCKNLSTFDFVSCCERRGIKLTYLGHTSSAG